MDIETLERVLQLSWCAETAYGDWHRTIPSMNQCAVTALIVHDYFGGKILCRKMTNGLNHYLNRLDNNEEVDLTATQFQTISPQPIKEKTTVYTRKKLLKFKSTVRRYELLKQKVEENLKNVSIPAS